MTGRSKRYGFHFGVLVIQIDDFILRGLSKILSGRTIFSMDTVACPEDGDDPKILPEISMDDGGP